MLQLSIKPILPARNPKQCGGGQKETALVVVLINNDADDNGSIEEHTNESTHMRADIWEHTYESTEEHT